MTVQSYCRSGVVQTLPEAVSFWILDLVGIAESLNLLWSRLATCCIGAFEISPVSLAVVSEVLHKAVAVVVVAVSTLAEVVVL